MAEIKVVLGDETPTTLNEDELFEYFTKDNPLNIAEAGIQLYGAAAKYAAQLVRPNIPELLLKKVVDMAPGIVIPIIGEPIKVVKRGGNDAPATLRVKFTPGTQVMSAAGLPRLTSTEEVIVTGIHISIKCAPIKFPGTDKILRDFVEKLSEEDAVLTRRYDGLYCPYGHLGRYYIAGERFDTAKTFHFTSGKILGILNGVFDYIIGELLYTRYADRIIDSSVSFALLPSRPKIPPAVEPPHTTSLLELEKIYPGRFTAVTPGAALSDAIRGGIGPIYSAAMSGVDVGGMIKDHIARMQRAKFLATIRSDIETNRAKIGTYLGIIGRKLGEKRAEEIRKQLRERPIVSLDVGHLLKLLTPGERRPVELEYKRREKYIEMSTKNTCEHVTLYNKLFHDVRKTEETYRALKGFFKGNVADAMITCNVCGFDIMCPHVRDTFEADFAAADQRTTRAMLTKYLDKSGARTQFFCKICGELLSVMEDVDDYKGIDDTVGVDEELSTYIWGEVAQLTRFLKFAVLVDTSKFISAVRDACYPFIYEIERQLIKSRTLNAEEFKTKKRLYTTIYAFSYFIHLTGKNISFRDFTPSKGANETVEMIKHVVRTISLVRNVAIKSIPGMTADVIKNKVVEAYKSFTAVTAVIQLGEPEDVLSTLLVDPVYHYVASIYRAVHGAKPSAGILSQVDDVLGATIQKVEKSSDIFGALTPLNFSKWNPSTFTKLAPFNGKIVEKGALICDAAAPGYTAEAYRIFREKLMSRVYTEPIFIEVPAADGVSKLDFEVQLSSPHQKEYDESTAFIAAEGNFLAYRRAAYAQNYTLAPGDGNRRWSEENITKIGRIYDENGRRHEWKYLDGEKLLSVKDYAAARVRGESPEVAPDFKCTVCGVLWSAAEDLNEDNIRAALRDKYTTANFFRYFETRCPVGGVHERSGDKCTKCGHLLSMSGEDAAAYKGKYLDVYTRERAEMTITYSPTVFPPAKTYEDMASEFATWAPNFDIVLDLAEKVGVNHQLILALGAVEKQDYKEIAAGTYIPAEVDDQNSTRGGLIDGHIRRLTIEYNRLRFIGNMPKPPPALLEILTAAGVARAAAPSIVAKLPPIIDGFEDKYAYFRENRRPRDIIKFLLQTWCEMCLRIWNDPTAETEKLRREFVKKYVADALRYEELLSKPGHFNWSLLYGDKEKERVDTNVTGEETDLAPVDTAGDEDDDGGGFDIDVDPDADPEDTGAGEIRVGEDYGMD